MAVRTGRWHIHHHRCTDVRAKFSTGDVQGALMACLPHPSAAHAEPKTWALDKTMRSGIL
jgi:hypothetical protein